MFSRTIKDPFPLLRVSGPDQGEVRPGGFFRTFAQAAWIRIVHNWVSIGGTTGIVPRSETARTRRVTVAAPCIVSSRAQASAFLAYYSAEVTFTVHLFRFSRPPGSAPSVAFALRNRASSTFSFGQAVSAFAFPPPPIVRTDVPIVLSAAINVDPNRVEEEIYTASVVVDAYAGGGGVGGFADALAHGTVTGFIVDGT